MSLRFPFPDASVAEQVDSAWSPRWHHEMLGSVFRKFDLAYRSSPSANAARCAQSYLAPPLGVLFLGLVALIAGQQYGNSEGLSTAELARSVGLFAQMCSLMSYSILIIEAYQLSKALQHDAAFSGQLIGMYMAASVIGSLVMAQLMRSYPDMWKMQARQVFLLSQLLGISGFSIYSAVTSYMAYLPLITPEATQSLSIFLLVGRAVAGAGQGISSTLLQVTFAHTTPVKERPVQMTRFVFVSTLGVGVGPLVAALMHLLDFCPEGGSPRFELVGHAQLVLAGAALFVILMYYPRLHDVEDFSEDALAGAQLQESTRGPQTVIVCGCLLNTFLRAMVVSGVEGATSFLLESEYKFALHEIGIIIGLTFLCCIPVDFLIETGRPMLSTFSWIRVLSGASLLGTSLLFRYTWQSLIYADIVLFPSLYLSDGILKGVMQQYALPMGSSFDQVGTTFWAKLLNSAGRFLGPWVARYLLETINQTGYAVLQVVLTLAFCIILEVMVILPARTVEWQFPIDDIPEDDQK